MRRLLSGRAVLALADGGRRIEFRDIPDGTTTAEQDDKEHD